MHSVHVRCTRIHEIREHLKYVVGWYLVEVAPEQYIHSVPADPGQIQRIYHIIRPRAQQKARNMAVMAVFASERFLIAKETCW
jgi:hypothetical protein